MGGDNDDNQSLESRAHPATVHSFNNGEKRNAKGPKPELISRIQEWARRAHRRCAPCVGHHGHSCREAHLLSAASS